MAALIPYAGDSNPQESSAQFFCLASIRSSLFHKQPFPTRRSSSIFWPTKVFLGATSNCTWALINAMNNAAFSYFVAACSKRSRSSALRLTSFTSMTGRQLPVPLTCAQPMPTFYAREPHASSILSITCNIRDGGTPLSLMKQDWIEPASLHTSGWSSGAM